MGLDLVETFMAIEDQLGIELEDDAMARAATVGDLADLAAALTPSPRDEVLAVIRLVASEQFALPLDRIRETTRWLDLAPHG